MQAVRSRLQPARFSYISHHARLVQEIRVLDVVGNTAALRLSNPLQAHLGRFKVDAGCISQETIASINEALFFRLSATTTTRRQDQRGIHQIKLYRKEE